MKSILLTWNPGRWAWEDFIGDRNELLQSGSLPSTWSCGVSRRIEIGDRVFLMRLGKPLKGKGLVGSGRVVGDVHEESHWDKEKAKAGKKTLYVDVSFDRLEETPVISEAELAHPPLNAMNWFPQASGTYIPTEVAEYLETMWDERFVTAGDVANATDLTDSFIEGAPYSRTSNSYERNRKARNKCLAHYGRICVCCELNFAERYGPEANGVIHVHHLEKISTVGKKYKIDPVRDLRPVCPNCHAVIHQRKELYSIEQVKTMLKRQRDS